MARLIDADKFLSSMIKRFKCVPLIGRNDYDCESLKQMLIEAQTVDAVPVVHGHWCWQGKFRACSKCGSYVEFTETLGASFWKFCPFCGAKMDLEVE